MPRRYATRRCRASAMLFFDITMIAYSAAAIITFRYDAITLSAHVYVYALAAGADITMITLLVTMPPPSALAAAADMLPCAMSMFTRYTMTLYLS